MTGLAAKLGLYVHWPYCAKICPYCDFNVRRDRADDTGFLVDAMAVELGHWRAKIDTPRPLTSISFGGGTPSRLTPAQLQQILAAAQQAFGFAPDIEISLEANPTDVEASKYREFAALGVNRLSLGLQSLDDQQLQFLGRDHDADEGLRALDIARQNFAMVSADFIYALPQQNREQWQRALSAILGLGLAHLSLYCLSIEPGTAFANQVRRDQWSPADNDQTADLYELTQNLCGQNGLPAYEISNHSRDIGNRSQHNILYWQGDDWIGIGPGAHARVPINGHRQALATHTRPQQYAEAVTKTGWGIQQMEALRPQDDLAERLMLGLRLTDGIDLELLQARAKTRLDPTRLQQACADQYLQQNGKTLRALVPLLVDRIAAELLE
ncbi:Radical SAM family enzyme, similar to coproporphyrinogen III oxidase, oxygen-independent, clustered with nucleoside-triphosphatase RdgB [hydrothermal vent metagenome]|uniref:Radical SAM family enzyme, similar to coproporphyrinogen III oxidase, oxygen-independent, clustered with nucleoside-triphosphatase RdgB n=1 Tax=hydrothermal vent metagenome TaxID=652676 RepID=A0A3B0S3A0_9ZZZZ